MKTTAEKLELLLKDPQKVVVICDDHMYVGESGKPPKMHTRCPNCWKSYFINLLAKVPPKEQKQFVDELEYVVKTMVHLEEKGQLDLKLYDKPVIQVETVPDGTEDDYIQKSLENETSR